MVRPRHSRPYRRLRKRQSVVYSREIARAEAEKTTNTREVVRDAHLGVRVVVMTSKTPDSGPISDEILRHTRECASRRIGRRLGSAPHHPPHSGSGPRTSPTEMQGTMDGNVTYDTRCKRMTQTCMVRHGGTLDSNCSIVGIRTPSCPG